MTERRGEDYKALLAEFTSVGIKPEVDLNGSGHLRFTFKIDGKEHICTGANTASDWRSVLNSRGKIRRTLRSLGVYDREPEKPVTLSKALTIPIAPAADPMPGRVEQLERDIGILLEMISEVSERAEKAAFEEGWNAHAHAVEQAVAQLHQPGAALPLPKVPRQDKPVRIAKVKPVRERKKTKPQIVLEMLEYDRGIGVADLAKRLNEKPQNISNALTLLGKSELAVNSNRMWWKRRPVATVMNGNGHANGYANGHAP